MYHNFSQSFCLTIQKNVAGEHSFVSKDVGYRKFLWIREEGVCHDFFPRFVSHYRKKFVRKHFGVLENFWFRKLFLVGEEGVCHDFFSKFLSHSTENIRRATLLFCRKFLVSKNVMDKRRRCCITIPCQSLCLQVPENFIGYPFVFEKTSGIENFYGQEKRGVYHDFCQSLCLTLPKNFVGQLFYVSKKYEYRKNLRKIRGLHYYLLIFFCSTVPKKFVRKHFGVSEKFWLRNFFDKRRGGLSWCSVKVFVSQYRKNS